MSKPNNRIKNRIKRQRSPKNVKLNLEKYTGNLCKHSRLHILLQMLLGVCNGVISQISLVGSHFGKKCKDRKQIQNVSDVQEKAPPLLK